VTEKDRRKLERLERLVKVGREAEADLRALKADLGLLPAPVVIDIPYTAVPKANKHKVAKRGFGKHAKRRVVNDLTGDLAKREESFLMQALAAVHPDDREGIPWTCPVEAHVVFVYRPTPSWAKWQWAAALARVFRYVKTPDLENVAKFVFDALEAKKGKPGFYMDDKLIWRQTLEKRYGEENRVIVTLTPYVQATASNWQELVA
jgi:Holliday junction resolvase RusA-like endonuclease